MKSEVGTDQTAAGLFVIRPEVVDLVGRAVAQVAEEDVCPPALNLLEQHDLPILEISSCPDLVCGELDEAGADPRCSRVGT